MYDAIGNNSIGFAEFIRLDGFPDPVGLKYEEITRPGMTGRAFRQLGYRGDPFTLKSVVDLTGDVAVVDAVNGYKSMQQSAQLVNIVFETDTYEYDGYLILDVKTEKPVPCTGGVGGINGGNRLLVAHWQMVYAGT